MHPKVPKEKMPSKKALKKHKKFVKKKIKQEKRKLGEA
jgi:hypothetical protein